ncbi:hypothetical protein VD0004_g2704 [Verticillium dahliae]|uniref:Uncharacterized protein n=1 Tax=Verticillium dahliae TaxID=27337 RepID=A0AA45AJE3_VERDA|nr:hypothetical protein BJF96_g7310 [Verticillium dahliae]PNH45108.1 hypothetical protein VD0004_g2704 [Verticillium dahliae]PNH54534.1 hypothetical protein VD0003_g3010 [Verticillium dahliae]PNH71249.1 hypothetical protein VD0001_g6305 [Verticillium dahliae]
MAMGLSQVSFKALSSPQGLFSRACSPGPPRDNQKLAGFTLIDVRSRELIYRA